MKKTLFVLLCLSLLLPSMADGRIWYVNQNASGTQSGTSWTNAFTDLQSALSAATGTDSIFVAKGTYIPSRPADGFSGDMRDRAFVLPGGVSLYGGFAGTEVSLAIRASDSTSLHVTNATILSGDLGVASDSTDNAYHVVIVSGASRALMDGFTVTLGNGDGSTPLMLGTRAIYRHYGGGIYNDSSMVTYSHMVVAKNTAVSFDDAEGGGAGMYNYKGKVTIDYMVLIRNHAENCNGGGMKNFLCNAQISHSRFVNNRAVTGDEGGGGVDNKNGSNAIFTDVDFVGNTTTGSGGGMYNDQSSPQLLRVHFSNNSAESCGGGMDTDGGSNASLTDVSFTGNSAQEDGGGLYGWQSSATLTRVQFTNNYAMNNGGGMYNYNTCNPMLTNVSFIGNRADNDYGGFGLERNSTAILTNVLIARNTAARNGGGMGAHDNNGSHATTILTNVTIVNNTAVNGGGGYDHGTTSQLRNSIIAGNYPDDVDINTALVPLSKHDIVGIDTGLIYIADGATNPLGVATSWPVFVDTGLSNYRLATGSPAIDAGDNSFYNSSSTPDLSSITVDLRGAPRIMGTIVDLGAMEYCTTTIAPTVGIATNPAGSSWAATTYVTFIATGANQGANAQYVWTRNDTVIAGATGSSWVATAGTDFQNGDTIGVTVTSSEPCASPEDTSAFMEVHVIYVGVPGVTSSGSDLALYPNPGNGSFTLRGALPQTPYLITVTDATGKKEYQQRVVPAQKETSRSLDLAGKLAPGMHFVILSNDQQATKAIRFIVQ